MLSYMSGSMVYLFSSLIHTKFNVCISFQKVIKIMNVCINTIFLVYGIIYFSLANLLIYFRFIFKKNNQASKLKKTKV